MFLKERQQNLQNGNRNHKSPFTTSNDDNYLVSLKIKYGNPFKPQINKTNGWK